MILTAPQGFLYVNKEEHSGQLGDMPFELWTIIAQFMCAEESLLLRAVSRAMNKYVSKSKELSYNALFNRPIQGSVAKYFKILD